MVKCSADDLDRVFTALADPTRRRIAEALSDGEMSLTDLGMPFDMTMPAVMKHIGIMENCGIVRTEKRGRTRYCRLDTQRFNDAQEWLARTTRMWTERLTALDEFLKENP